MTKTSAERAPGRGRRRVQLALVALAAALVLPQSAGAHDGRGPRLAAAPAVAVGGSITGYLAEPGDQAILVPDGRYTGGRVEAPHPATGGRYKGWLVLVAEHPGGVVVDLTSANLLLTGGTSRVLFVGFRFVDGTIVHKDARDIAYWYTTHTYPIAPWQREYQAHGRDLDRMVHRTPTAVRVSQSERISFFGSDFHAIGDDAIAGTGTSGLLLDGVRITDVDDHGHDPGDLFHNDAIGSSGGLDGLVVRNSFLGQRVYIGAERGDQVGLRFEHVWSTGAKSAGFIFASFHERVRGVRRDVWSWGHDGKGAHDRIDVVDGTNYVPPQLNARPARIAVQDSQVRTRRPTGPDPASVWRQQHAYATWATWARVAAR